MPNSHIDTGTEETPFPANAAIGDMDLIGVLCAQYGFTRKRLFFCEWYVQLLNGQKAAVKAGFAAPAQAGSFLLSDPKCSKYINDRFKQLRMKSDEILGRLADIARGDIGDYLKTTKDKPSDIPLTIDGKIINDIYIDLSSMIRDGNTARIKKYTRVRGEVSIELHDPIKALELIGKHLRLWADVSASDDRPVKRAEELSDDDLARIATQGTPQGASTAGAADGVSSGEEPENGAQPGIQMVDARVDEMASLDRMILRIEGQISTGELQPHTLGMNNAQRALTTYKHRLAFLKGETA